MTQDERPRLFEPDPESVLDSVPDALSDALPEFVDLADGESRAARVNPWLTGLWVASVVLTVGSISLILVGYGAQYELVRMSVVSEEHTARTTNYAIMSALAPGIFAIGLASAVAAASIHAVQWMRRHP
jgi:hypothetical protein